MRDIRLMGSVIARRLQGDPYTLAACPWSPQMTDPIELSRHDGWAVIRMTRHAKRNAFDAAMRAELLHALESLDDVRAVVLTGCGVSFCAGLDLKEDAADTAAGRAGRAGAEWTALMMAIHDHPAIFIAAVNGVALGGGVTLINTCDLALASTAATMGCPEIGLSIYPGMAGPTTQLRLAPKAAAWLVLTGQRIDAATAERWGLVNQVVPAEELETRAGELAARLAGFEAVPLAESKKALHHIPAVLTDWKLAMQYGADVNDRIRERLQGRASHS